MFEKCLFFGKVPLSLAEEPEDIAQNNVPILEKPWGVASEDVGSMGCCRQASMEGFTAILTRDASGLVSHTKSDLLEPNPE